MLTAIDTHAHIDHLENPKDALDRAHFAGVEGVVAVGVDLASNKKNLELKRTIQKPKIYLALGVHPGNIKPEEIEETLRFTREHIQEAVAIGEIGLDFWYKWVRKDDVLKSQQRSVFRQYVDLAREFNLPVIVHARGTWKECLMTLKEFNISKAVFHWYSGPLDVLEEILVAGYFISASPSIALSKDSREAVSFAPIERTFIETDTPVFYNDDFGGFKAEPKDVFRTLRAYSELKGIEQEKALKILNQNAKDFFGLT